MALCEHAGTCPFYQKTLPSMPPDADSLTKDFCEGNSLHCARSMAYDAGVAAPDDLMPADKAAAYVLIAGG